jgi:hypothetical protein
VTVILEHRETSSAEARRGFYSVVAGALVGAASLYVLGPQMWADSPVLVTVFAGTFIAGCCLGLFYAVKNWRASDDFVCRLDHDQLTCSCPIGGAAVNFTVAVQEIVRVERQEWEGGHDWYLIDRAGQRVCLTSDYVNPADRFVALIRELNPDIVEVVT